MRGEPDPPVEDPPDWLLRDGATFVTLTEEGRLRGCLGTLEPRRPLLEDLRSNARASALHDPRFPPVTAAELPLIRVEVSLLGAMRPVEAASEEEAVEELSRGRDGWLLRYDGYSGTFLPQVWESLPEPREFLAHLKHKAGLPMDFWHPEIRLWRYPVEKWKE